jgi:hypothetical protein
MTCGTREEPKRLPPKLMKVSVPGAWRLRGATKYLYVRLAQKTVKMPSALNRLPKLTPETDCDKTATSLPLATSVVFLTAK